MSRRRVETEYIPLEKPKKPKKLSAAARQVLAILLAAKGRSR